MKKILFLGIACLALTLTSCRFVSSSTKTLKGFKALSSASESGINMGERVYNDLVEFNFIDSEGAYDIEWTKGPECVSVSAPDELLHHLVVKSEGGKLLLTTDGSKIKNWKNVKVHASSPALCGLNIKGAVDFAANDVTCDGDFDITVSGAADLKIKGLKAGDVKLVVNGAGDMEIDNMDCGTVDVIVNGAGNIELAGNCDSVNAEINGAGEIDIKHLSYKDSSLSRNGIGRILR